MHFKRYATIGMVSMLMFGLFGCGSEPTNDKSTDATKTVVETVADEVNEVAKDTASEDMSDVFSERDLDDSYWMTRDNTVKISFDESGVGAESDDVTIVDRTVTLTKEGTYIISGTSDNAQIVVDADGEKVQLVLDNTQLTNDTAPVLYAKAADKVFVTSAEDSVNVFTTTGAIEADDENNLDGTIFCKSDLTINGAGSFSVVSKGNHGIVVKDDLVLATDSLGVEAASHAIQVKGVVGVHHGSYTLTAGKDAIHAEDSDTPEDAFVYIADGTFKIAAESDGIDAGGALRIDSGEFSVDVADDGLHSESDVVINDGKINITKCNEGIEGATVTVNGGDVDVTAVDDGVNATGTSESTGSAFDTNDTVSDNEATMNNKSDMEPPEGEFGTNPPDMNTDSGAGNSRPEMASGGPREGSNFAMEGVPQRQDFGGGAFGNDSTAKLVITGGNIHVDCGGDGLDSNGSIKVSGGNVFVDGPTNDGNAAMDYGDGATASITGGVVVAVGGAGMATNFTEATQGSALVTLNEATSGKVAVTDSDGTEIVSFEPSKTYTSVLVSSPDMVENVTYTISCGDTSQDVTLDGYLYGKGGMGGRLGESPYSKVRHG